MFCTVALFLRRTLARSAASWVRQVGGAESCNFPTDRCKSPTEEILGCQNFNFAPNFFGRKEHFSTKRKFSGNFPTAQNLGKIAPSPAPCHDATERGCDIFSASIIPLQLFEKRRCAAAAL